MERDDLIEQIEILKLKPEDDEIEKVKTLNEALKQEVEN